MRKKLLAMALCAGLMSTTILGCGNSNNTTTTEAQTTVAGTTTAGTTTAGTTSEGTTAEGETSAEGTTAEGETGAEGTTAAGETEEVSYNYSKDIAENGYVIGVTASDYITLGDYNHMTFAKADLEPTEETVQADIDAVLAEYPTEITDRAIEANDIVNIDYVGKVDGVEFEGGSATGADVTAGSSEFIDDFLTQIIGHTIGETFDVEVTFPDPYQNNTELSGKEAVFTVTINSISAPAELTDEFVTTNLSNTGCTNVEELRQYVRDYYYNQSLQSAIATKVVEDSKYSEIPQAAYDVEYNTTEANLYESYGIDFTNYLSVTGMTEDELKETLDEQAFQNLIFQAISEKENIEITSDDFHLATGTEDNTTYTDHYGTGYVARVTMRVKVMEYLVEHSTVE